MSHDELLRRDVRFLGDLLGSVIEELAGPEPHALVEEVRRLARERRQGRHDAEPALAAPSPPADAALTVDAPTQATVDALDLDAPPLLTDFLANGTAATDKPRRRRSPGPHERRLPDAPDDTADCDGSPWPRGDARSSDFVVSG